MIKLKFYFRVLNFEYFNEHESLRRKIKRQIRLLKTYFNNCKFSTLVERNGLYVGPCFILLYAENKILFE